MTTDCKFYAFWKYDLCPNVIGGFITEFLDDGLVDVSGYGPIKPLVILWGNDGEIADREITRLWAEYRMADDSLRERYTNAAYAAVGIVETTVT